MREKIDAHGKAAGPLRKLANGIDTIFQIGKGGLGEPLIIQINDALEARELVKIRVLDTANDPPPPVRRGLRGYRGEPSRFGDRKPLRGVQTLQKAAQNSIGLMEGELYGRSEDLFNGRHL
jgi:hypothetical protein